MKLWQRAQELPQKRHYDKNDPANRPTGYWESAGFPFRHRENSVRGSCQYTELQVQAIRKIIELADDPGFVLLLGPRGTGKTQIATEAMRSLDWYFKQEAEIQPTMRYWQAEELFTKEKETWGQRDKTSPLPEARTVDYLVLDEAQSILGREYEERMFTSVMDTRYGGLKRTVLIYNLTAAELKERLDPSTVSRFKETGRVVHCNWEGFR